MEKVQTKNSEEELTVVTLVIVFNEKYRIANVLDSLIKSSHKTRIIVCDNASTDGVEQYLHKHYPQVQYIRSEENIGTAAYNLALPFINEEFILTLATDMEIKKDTISELFKYFKVDTGVVGMRYETKEGSPMVSACWFSRSFYSSQRYSNELKEALEVNHVGNSIMRTTIAKKFGYIFCPDYFMYNEDMDLGLRVRLIGFKTLSVPISIYHQEATTTKKVLSKQKLVYFAERNALVTFLKICEAKNVFFWIPYVFGMRIVMIVSDVLRLKFYNIKGRIDAIVYVITHMNEIKNRRMILQQMRTKADSFVFKLANEGMFLKKLVSV